MASFMDQKIIRFWKLASKKLKIQKVSRTLAPSYFQRFFVKYLTQNQVGLK